MKIDNKITLKFLSLSVNESFARSVISCFALQLNPSVSEISDIKTAVSEAVTNSIVHAYAGKIGEITLEAWIEQDIIHINIIDNGIGINDVEKALEPFYTTREEEERSGMGFTIMKSFMDAVEVVSTPNVGTKIYMYKKIKVNL